eukprot:14505190-Ditylum_brightwellii.AAC.1
MTRLGEWDAKIKKPSTQKDGDQQSCLEETYCGEEAFKASIQLAWVNACIGKSSAGVHKGSDR